MLVYSGAMLNGCRAPVLVGWMLIGDLFPLWRDLDFLHSGWAIVQLSEG